MPEARPVVARVGAWGMPLGTQRSVNALGATIAYRLEPQADAQRFPALLTELWRGRLAPSRADAALVELDIVQRELAALPAEKAVWSVSDLRKQSDAGESVNRGARSLAEYFVTPEGRPLLDALREAVQRAKANDQPLVVGTWARSQGWRRGAFFTALGMVGAVVCFVFFPDVVVSKGMDPDATIHHGLLLWMLMLMIAGVGIWELAETALPALAVWRRERRFFSGFLRAVFLLGMLWLGWR
jgi:hypothetical protein